MRHLAYKVFCKVENLKRPLHKGSQWQQFSLHFYFLLFVIFTIVRRVAKFCVSNPLCYATAPNASYLVTTFYAVPFSCNFRIRYNVCILCQNTSSGHPERTSEQLIPTGMLRKTLDGLLYFNVKWYGQAIKHLITILRFERRVTFTYFYGFGFFLNLLLFCIACFIL